MFDRRLIVNFDWVLCLVVLALCGVGLVAIHSATLANENAHYFQRQIYWILLGLGVAFFTTLIDYRIFVRFGYVFHLGVILLLILVLLFGTGGPGSPVKRWLDIGPMFIQPSEFAKFSLVLVLAHHFKERRTGNIGFVDLLWPSLLLLIPSALIYMQPDLGTALMLIMVFMPIIFLVGIKLWTMLVIGLGVLISTPFAWYFLLKPYQKDRIKIFLNPDLDPLGRGYHVTQSKIAVGSGGLMGKGFEEGTQAQLKFLPAHHTDFIFSVLAEEWGFVGGVFVLLLYLFLMLWAMAHVLKTKDRTSAILTVGVVAIVASQVLVNIGMVLGLMPVVGVPLPFMSYGGSSMLSMMLGIGLLLNIGMRRFQFQ